MFTKDLKRPPNTPARILKILKKENEISYLGWLPLLKMKRLESQSKCLDSFEGTALAGIELLHATLNRFLQNGFPIPRDDYKPSTDETVKELGDVMGKLKKLANDSQTFAFESESPNDVYQFRKNRFLARFQVLDQRR